MSQRFDVVVAGAGPAGRALSVVCAERGLRVALVAGNHEARWPNTYGVWLDELHPMDVADTVAVRWPTPVVRGGDAYLRLSRTYALLDNERLRSRLRERFGAAGGREISATVSGAAAREAFLDDGSALEATVVIDSTGHDASLLRFSGDPCAYQTAYGVVATCSSPPGEPGTMTLMDLRQWPLGDVREPTFLYAMHLEGDRWFVEETSLARRDPMPFPALEARLRRRLTAIGVALADEQPPEHCIIPLGTPLPPPQPVLAYGAAAGMIHPATGYQVGTALSRAPELADALTAALDGSGSDDAALGGWQVLWNEDRRRQRALHELGLQTLLRFEAAEFEQFFTRFFTLPEGRWRAYLSDAASARDVRRTMLRVFATSTGRVRRKLILALAASRASR